MKALAVRLGLHGNRAMHRLIGEKSARPGLERYVSALTRRVAGWAVFG